MVSAANWSSNFCTTNSLAAGKECDMIKISNFVTYKESYTDLDCVSVGSPSYHDHMWRCDSSYC